jgi:hypothetical protein
MPISDVGIANAALIDLGHEPIQSFLDDSDQAKAVNAIYSMNRDRVTASHPWNFATQRVSLAAAVITLHTNEWDNAYLLPADVLRVLYIEPKGTPFAVENGYILTNASSPVLAPVLMRVTDPAKFSANFVSALQYRLAASLCTAITTRRGHAQDYWRLYQLELQEARTADGMEGWEAKENDSPIGFARVTGVNMSAHQLTDGEWF